MDKEIKEFIDIKETLKQKCIADIADQIAASKKVKVILIAGPSSSGKTTTSKKLALELRAIGYKPKVISLDCYYVGRDRNPKDENGEYTVITGWIEPGNYHVQETKAPTGYNLNDEVYDITLTDTSRELPYEVDATALASAIEAAPVSAE